MSVNETQKPRGLFMAYKFLPETAKINIFLQGKPYQFNKLHQGMINHLEYTIKQSFNGDNILTYETIDKESTLKTLLMHRGLILGTESILSTVSPTHICDWETTVEALLHPLHKNLGFQQLQQYITETHKHNQSTVEHEWKPLINLELLHYLQFPYPEIQQNPDKDITIYWNYHSTSDIPEIENPNTTTIVILNTTYNDKEWDNTFQYQDIDKLEAKGYIIPGRTAEPGSPIPTKPNQAPIDDVFVGLLNHIGNLKLARYVENLKNSGAKKQETKEPNLLD